VPKFAARKQLAYSCTQTAARMGRIKTGAGKAPAGIAKNRKRAVDGAAAGTASTGAHPTATAVKQPSLKKAAAPKPEKNIPKCDAAEKPPKPFAGASITGQPDLPRRGEEAWPE
jgi:hypothetical protein